MMAWAPALQAAPFNGFEVLDPLVPINEIKHGGPPRDGIPAIDAPVFTDVESAKHVLPESRVLGVARNGVAKAYPVNILTWHEIVNDRFGDEAVLVTYCPLCGTGMAFDPPKDFADASFGVSGLLYNSDMLLYDRGTESLWSQIVGLAITGPMKGRRLTALPTANTTWREWLARHPNTLVLSEQTGHRRDYWTNPYDGYERTNQILFPVGHTDSRYHPKEWVLGLELDGARRAWPFAELRAAGTAVVEDRIGDTPVRVHFDAANHTARVYDANSNELPGLMAYWFAWVAFHPQTGVYTAPATGERR